MDEILIEEKKYISSKRAAKITGYAKDYVGQLCREGRVPARLVGRSWYVLESAIQDHRFGNKEFDIQKITLESPRYEAIPVEAMPPVVREQEKQEQNPQDSWKEWFDHIEQIKTEEKEEPANIAEETIPESIIETGIEDEIIPIHTVYDLPPSDLLPQNPPRSATEAIVLGERQKPRHSYRTRLIGAIKVVGVVVAIIVTATAIIGNGYFDTYVQLSEELRPLAGMLLYEK